MNQNTSQIYFKDLDNHVLEPISFYVKEFEPSFYMGMHNHGYFEFMYAHKGTFYIEIMQEKETEVSEIVTVHQGELIFFDAYLFHRLRVYDQGVVIYNIELEPKNREEYNPFNINSIFPIHYKNLIRTTNLKALASVKNGYIIIPDTSKISIVFRNLISSAMKTSSTFEDACSVQCLLMELYMEISKSVASLTKTHFNYIRKIFIYIKHHLNQKITLDEIAQEIGFNKSYIATQFKKFTGKSIMETINSLRIEKSLQLLHESILPVRDIVKQVGFSSYNQMVYEFKRKVGLSPSDCRKVFLNDEMDYCTKLYNSVAIRINDEDFMLDDENFYNKFYKKNIESLSQKLLD